MKRERRRMDDRSEEGEIEEKRRRGEGREYK
jgi:hypothetical protein